MATITRSGIDPNHHKSISAVDAVTGDPFAVQGDAATGSINVSVASLPLPSGAATAANQVVANTSLATIATNTTGLATSANQTNGTQQSRITDGTNIASVIAGDAGYNGIATAMAAKTITFSTSVSGAQTILANTNVEGYSWIEIVYTSVGSGLALTGQFSTTSGGTYVNSSTFGNGGAAVAALGTTVNTIYDGPIRGNYFQIAVSALASGTFSGTVTLRNGPTPFTVMGASQSGTWNVGSSSATGSAVPANGFYMSGIARTSSPTAATNGNLTGMLMDVLGEQVATTGGLVTTAVASGTSGNTVIKATAGRLCNVVVTTSNTNQMNIYDNASTASGTIIGAVPASAAVGTTYTFSMPAAAGITVQGNANNPGVTISWV